MTKIIEIPENLKNKIQWEKKLKTEFMTFNYLLKNDINLPATYVAFPWAFLIDTFNCKYKSKYNSFFDFIYRIGLLDLLNKEKNLIKNNMNY